MSMINVSTAICAARLRLPISNATTMVATPTFTNNLKVPRKKRFVRKRWKGARSKPLATTAGDFAKSKRSRLNVIQRLKRQIPVALSIAGSDSSAGAGLQADLKTFGALGVYGVTAVTCIVAETPGKVVRLEPVSATIVREQINVLCKNFPIAAIKTGLLCSAEIVKAVAHELIGRVSHHGIPLVIDPVMVATSGDRLLEPKAIRLCETKLFPLATLLTPNLNEAGNLLGEKISNRKEMERAVRALAEKYLVPVLLKGGHLPGKSAVDLLCVGGEVREFAGPFVRDVVTHGTGCTYSAAITAGLARGLALNNAIGQAKKFISSCLVNRFRWTMSGGKSLDALNQLNRD